MVSLYMALSLNVVDRLTARAVEARKANNTDAEIAAYGQVLGAYARNAPASFNLSLALERRGNLDAALAQAEQTLALMPGDEDAMRVRDRLAGAVRERGR